MNITLTNHNSHTIAEIDSNMVVISEVQDALDLMVNAGARRIILKEEHLNPAFFDLKTRLAGEILQKFVNYSVKLAIVGDFSKYSSKSLRDFIYESNKSGPIFFVSTMDEARTKLGK